MHRFFITLAAALCLAHTARAQSPLTSIFTYQGELRAFGDPISTPVDLRFRLYDAPTLGNQIGPELTATLTPADGRFTTDLDFGAAFTGQNRYLEIDVRNAGGPSYSTLTTRQPLHAAPHAAFALTAAAATDAALLNGQTAAFYQSAANLIAGTLPDSRLSTNIPRLDAAQTFTFPNNFSHHSNTFAGNGALLTSLNASNIAGGTLADARLSTNIPRLNASNTFTGINSFSGTVHSNLGFIFPDFTLQTTAALDPGERGIYSGYPASTTIAISISGTTYPTARMVDGWTLRRDPGGPLTWQEFPRFRRPVTSNAVWRNWVINETSLGGAAITVTWGAPGTTTYTLPAGRATAYQLVTGDDGLPFEEITYIAGSNFFGSTIITNTGVPTATVNLPTIAPRLGATTGGPLTSTYRSVWNNTRSDVAAVVGNPWFIIPTNPATGLPTGNIQNGVCTIRTNTLGKPLMLDQFFLAGTTRTFRLVIHPATGPDINCLNNATANITTMTVFIADDGLPIEDYNITFPLQ